MIGELIAHLWDMLPQLIAALVGTLGFALVFKMKGVYIPFVCLGGFATYGIYLVMTFLGRTEFTAALTAAMFFALLSEILANTLKAPTVIFLTTISISIIPGSGLYYSMKYFLMQDMESFAQTFKGTCAIAAGIVCGIVIVSIAAKIFIAVRNHVKTASK